MNTIGITYLYLLAGLGITAASAETPLYAKTAATTIGEFVGILAILFMILYQKPGPFKVMLAIVFAVLIGQTLVSVVNDLESKNLLRTVLVTVAGIFLGMTAAGFYDTNSFLGLGGYLLAALFGLIVARIALFFVTKPEDMSRGNTILSWVGTVLFSVYIAYDTQTLKYASRTKPDYINNSLGLFLDVINLFGNVEDLYS
jgi:FtsH-binding integral membrane protein